MAYLTAVSQHVTGVTLRSPASSPCPTKPQALEGAGLQYSLRHALDEERMLLALQQKFTRAKWGVYDASMDEVEVLPDGRLDEERQECRARVDKLKHSLGTTLSGAKLRSILNECLQETSPPPLGAVPRLELYHIVWPRRVGSEEVSPPNPAIHLGYPHRDRRARRPIGPRAGRHDGRAPTFHRYHHAFQSSVHAIAGA